MVQYSSAESLRVRDIMSTPVTTARENDDVYSVTVKMWKRRIASVVVMNSTGKATGMITQGDIIRRLASSPRGNLHSMKASQLMSKPLRFISGNEKIADAARAMVEHGIKRLCVIDENKKLVGIVTDNDIMKNAGHLIDVLNEIINTQES